MATLKEIRDAIDAKLQTRWTNLVARQDTYAANHDGRFFQGLVTHGTMPKDGVDSDADRISTKPTDQTETWNDFGIASWRESFALRIDTYDGPQGKGWVATVSVMVGDKKYSRSRGVGPERRNASWAEVVDGIIG